MKTVLMKAMMTSISEVMETMFFLPVDFGGEMTLTECALNNEKILAGQLAFNGDVSGSLTIVASESLVAEMAENFMGDPKDQLTQEHFSGTLTEMLNMVCGNALSKIDTQIPFELGIPEVVSETEYLAKEMFSIIETPQSRMAIRLNIG